MTADEKEQMNIVLVGHVDHGKSTLLGRLLADTDSLPDGKLEQVRENCRLNSKEFEYAFLLDALKDEQSQGVTIDSARCFFRTNKRDYIIIDAPGHIEFLKNMISGAARAEAALLVIDANEGIQENSKRHASMLSMLRIKQVVICVNKMDLIDYDKKRYETIKKEFTAFLKDIKIIPKEFIAVSAREGDNVAEPSKKMDWFNGKNILSILDDFRKEKTDEDKPLRMPVQDIYKFTKADDRRIIAGRIESGTFEIGDKVVFLPSNKRSRIKSVEEFNAPERERYSAGECVGITLDEQLFLNRGEMMCHDDGNLPQIGARFRANIFWMGKMPAEKKKEYKLKLTTTSMPVKIKDIISVMDASDLSSRKKATIEKNEVAKCVLECQHPIAFDRFSDIKATGRFVLVDDFEISGGGIITDLVKDSESRTLEQVYQREKRWERGIVYPKQRAERYSQLPKVILLTGKTGHDKKSLAKNVEQALFNKGKFVYFLGIGNILRGLDADVDKEKREEHIRRFGEVAHILMDAGLIVLATASDLVDEELKLLEAIIGSDALHVILVGESDLTDFNVDIEIEPQQDLDNNTNKIIEFLKFRNVIFNP